MINKINEFEKARQKKADDKIWTREEIFKRAQQERETFKKLERKEPDNLVSGGDMEKILEEKKMTKIVPNKIISEKDKQKKPVDGEVSIKTARTQAAIVATQERMLARKKKI